jgi:hypothetical protein
MPPNQRVGLDDNESLAPIKPAGQSAESESDGAGSPAWFDFSLDEQTELFCAGMDFLLRWWQPDRDRVAESSRHPGKRRKRSGERAETVLFLDSTKPLTHSYLRKRTD